jgi:hypothetical protein
VLWMRTPSETSSTFDKRRSILRLWNFFAGDFQNISFG